MNIQFNGDSTKVFPVIGCDERIYADQNSGDYRRELSVQTDSDLDTVAALLEGLAITQIDVLDGGSTLFTTTKYTKMASVSNQIGSDNRRYVVFSAD